MAIDKFEGKYRWLSNFWPVVVEMDGCKYPSIEHAYQAAKFLDPNRRHLLQECLDPDPEKAAKKAKKIGKLKGIRVDWDQIKLAVMEDLLEQKFLKGDLSIWLEDTGDEELIEGNWWGDTYWGVCNGKGDNHLGKLLMKIREGNR